MSLARIQENYDSVKCVDALTDGDMARLALLDTTDGTGRLNKGFSFLQEGEDWRSMWAEDWVEPSV